MTLACAASLAAIGAPGGLAASTSVPAKDSFTGRIAAATGKFAGDHGTMKIFLVPGGGQATATRPVTVSIQGSPCSSTPRCVRLAGKLVGTLAPGPRTNPDVGRIFTIAATGAISPLGHVSATGTVHGTGFINNGHESVALRLTRPGGTVRIEATSGPVRGFTSP